jgi:hypothetical protein
LIKALRPGSRVGADPNLVQYSIWKPLQTDLEAGGLFLVPITTNLIDLMWEDKPPVPCNVIEPLSVKYTGNKECFTSLYQLLNQSVFYCKGFSDILGKYYKTVLSQLHKEYPVPFGRI